jgi:hypothetical protein
MADKESGRELLKLGTVLLYADKQVSFSVMYKSLTVVPHG